MTYEYEILTELRAINGMLVKIFEAMQQQQQSSGYSINANWDFDSHCDHEWVPYEDGLTTAISLYHCAKCGLIRA